MTERKSFSPVIKPARQKKDLSFAEMIVFLIKGDKVARKDWPKKAKSYCFLKDSLMQIHNNGFHSWVISRDDLEATDWEVIQITEEEEKK